ncbi:MAG: hypothetical protein HeimC3_01350 [Candidatus Heimdallarchaeota archaeon LC_3]|nr:MAG: hypothetical protein HeimC3_01350 [Candidatus Heimdallarchaeota archaeon LC_3]
MKYKLMKNPVIFGVSIALLTIFINISIVSIAEGSLREGIEIILENGIFVLLVPLAVGIQMFLFRYHRNLVKKYRYDKSEKIGVTGSVTSSGAMILCCLHHITDLLPTFGFLITMTTFLSEYNDIFIIFGLLINFLVSIYILRAIIKDYSILKLNIKGKPEIS